MDKKKIKTLLGFLRDLRAPLKLIPALLGIVIILIRRILEEDITPTVKVLHQGFLGRKSIQFPAGCSSPAVTQCLDGSFAAAFVYTAVEGGRLVNRICLTRAKDSDGLACATKRTVYQTVLSPEQITITDTVFGLLLCWDNCGGRSAAAPQAFGSAVAEALEKNTEERRQAAVADLGRHFALIQKDGEAPVQPRTLGVNAAQPPVKLSDSELLFVTAQDGKAAVSRCVLPNGETQPISTVPLPQEGGLICLEAAAAKLKNGRLAAVLNLSGELYYSFSDDMGVRWSRCSPMGIKASSPNLCVRTDGVTALTYLVPGRTLAVCARVSPDGQDEWGDERVVIAAAAADYHRPVTAACGDAFLTVSHQRYTADRSPSVLMTQWREKSADAAEEEPADQAKEEGTV